MQHLSRMRISSVSDIHIHRCDCDNCDGTGRLGQGMALTGADECPACEGLGYLDPLNGSEEAYKAYLDDLYHDVIRTMPTIGNRTLHAA